MLGTGIASARCEVIRPRNRLAPNTCRVLLDPTSVDALATHGPRERGEFRQRSFSCRLAAPRSMKRFPLNKGGGAKRQGVVWVCFPGQPPEGFAFSPPLIRGIFRELQTIDLNMTFFGAPGYITSHGFVTFPVLSRGTQD